VHAKISPNDFYFYKQMERAYYFTSERLGFRNWLAQDVEPMAALNADPENMEFFEHPTSPEKTAADIERNIARLEAGELGPYAVDRLDTGAFIGFIGFGKITFESSISPCIEIGWRLDKAHWGNGFATEGAAACLNEFWKKYPETPVRAITAISNKRSERVMEKLGMKVVDHFNHPMVSLGHVLRPHICYEIQSP